MQAVEIGHHIRKTSRRNAFSPQPVSRVPSWRIAFRTRIVAAEPDSEAAFVAQEDVGWFVSPEDAAQLALTIRQAVLDRAGTMQKGQRAAKLAKKYGEGAARYREIVLRTVPSPDPAAGPGATSISRLYVSGRTLLSSLYRPSRLDNKG
jgi:hypothetical protein